MEKDSQITVEANQEFTLADYDKIKDSIIRKNKSKDGTLYKGDIFKCNVKMAKYLNGNNENNLKVVEIIGVN